VVVIARYSASGVLCVHSGRRDLLASVTDCNAVALVLLSRLVDLVVKQYVRLFFMHVSFSPDVVPVC